MEKASMESIENTVDSKKNQVSKGYKLEDRLILAKKISKERLAALQHKHYKQIQQLMQKAPKISKNSQMLAKVPSVSSVDLRSAYIKSILSTSRSHRKMKFVKPYIVKSVKICLDNLDLRPSNCKSPCSYKIIRNSAVSKPQHQRLLEQCGFVTSPSKTTNASTPSLLNLDPVSRNDQWSLRKKEKINKTRENLMEKSASECTFSPDLTPRIKFLSGSPSIRSPETSYSKLHSSPRKSEKKSHKTPPDPKSFSPKNPFSLCNYQSLSPHTKKISFKSGMNFSKFLQTARRMHKYPS